ncbi:MAG: hypothetical protein ABIP55_02290 [Tepidisphaeraceae bacterium]
MVRLVLMVGLSYAIPAFAAAPGAKPAATNRAATQATTTQAATTQSVPADPSTPRGALKRLAQALDAGERAVVLDLLSAESDAQRKWATATADLAEATAALRRSAVAGFGPQGSRGLAVDAAASPEALARIDGAEVAITGDSATVRPAQDEGPPIVLVRRDGRWRVPVSEFSRDVEAVDLDRAIAALADETRLLRELATEVSAGKYKTAADARQALDRRILQSAMPQLEPVQPAATTMKP